MMVLKLGQAGTVACPEDKHERLEVLVNLPGLVHHAGLTPGPMSTVRGRWSASGYLWSGYSAAYLGAGLQVP
jgi:hypothetical protein